MGKQRNTPYNEVDLLLGNSQSSQQSIPQDDNTQEASINTVAKMFKKAQEKPTFTHSQTEVRIGIGNTPIVEYPLTRVAEVHEKSKEKTLGSLARERGYAQVQASPTNQDYSLDIPQEPSTQETQIVNNGAWSPKIDRDKIARLKAEHLKKQEEEKRIREQEAIERRNRSKKSQNPTLEDTLLVNYNTPDAQEITPEEYQVAISQGNIPKPAVGFGKHDFGPANRILNHLPGTKKPQATQQDNPKQSQTKTPLEKIADEEAESQRLGNLTRDANQYSDEDLPLAGAVEPGYGRERVRNQTVVEAALANQNIAHEFTIEEYLADKDYTAAIKYCQKNGLEERARELEEEQKTQKEIEKEIDSMPLVPSEGELSLRELDRRQYYKRLGDKCKELGRNNLAQKAYNNARKIRDQFDAQIKEYTDRGLHEKLADTQMRLADIERGDNNEKRAKHLIKEAETSYMKAIDTYLSFGCYDSQNDLDPSKSIVEKAESHGLHHVRKHYEHEIVKVNPQLAPKQGFLSRIFGRNK